MTNDFPVSVVIPTFNRASVLPRAIESVLAQTFPAAEVIVVDDGSTDESLAVLEQFQNQITLFELGSNNGVSRARNFGIQHARSRWIALLDSDDYWLPDKLLKQVEFHLLHPDLRISQTDEIWIRNGKRVNPRHKHTKLGGWIFEECLPLCIVSPSAVVFEKSLWTEMGGFDETLPVCEDYDLWLRIAAKYPIGLFDEPLIVKTGGHPDQLSRAFWGMDRFRIQAMEKHLSSNLRPEWRLALLNSLCEKCEIVYQGAEKRGNTAIADGYRTKLNQFVELQNALTS